MNDSERRHDGEPEAVAEDQERTEPIEIEAAATEVRVDAGPESPEIEAAATERHDAAGSEPPEIEDSETERREDTGPEPPAAIQESDAVQEPPPVPEAAAGDTFTWHPDYAGRSVDAVRAELAQEIASDQRQHRLAMEGAEEAEHDALASVVTLERKWGVYDFDWADQDAADLADRIVAFEQERERRHQMLTWAEYRAEGYADDEAHGTSDRVASDLGTGAKALSLALVVLLIVVILLAVWWL